MFRHIVFLAILLLPWSALAHSSRLSSSNPTGLPIPSLSHGEMAVLTGYRSEIRKLAGEVKFTDPTFRTLMNYGAIQFTYCLWGLAPGAIADEESPFNECAHAYLSADKALLLHMRGMANKSAGVDDLVSRIDVAMVKSGAAFIGCQYSGETFDTADILTPHWENIPGHHPSLAALGLCGFLLAAPVAIGAGRKFRLISRTGK